MVTFLSRILKHAHKHTRTHTWSWRKARPPHLMTHKHRARELSQPPKAKLPWELGVRSGQPTLCLVGECWANGKLHHIAQAPLGSQETYLRAVL